MSYILKALRKSEAERAKGMVPRLTTRHDPEPPPRRRLWPALAGGALLVNLSLLALVLWQPGILPAQWVGDDPANSERAQTAPQPATETAALVSVDRQIASLDSAGDMTPADALPSPADAAPSVEPATAPPAVLEPAAAPVVLETLPGTTAEPQPEAVPPQPEAVAPPPAVERVAAEDSRPEEIATEEPVREEIVAEENASEQPAPEEVVAEAPPLPKAKPAAATLRAERTITNRVEEGLDSLEPAADQLAWAAPVPEVPATPPPPAPVELFADVPELWRMSQTFRQSVPDMTISVHVYSPDERRRFIIVDRRKYWEGDHLNGGVLVEAILPQGVVFTLNGQQFKLISG